MGIVKSEGIILRSKKYSETSLILDVYTKDYGLQSLIVSGVRKSKSRSKAGIYQVMNIIDVVFYDNQKETLSRIKEAKVKLQLKALSRNIVKSSIGMLMTEIFRNAIQEKETNQELYSFLRKWYEFLDITTDGVGNISIKYMLSLCEQLGFQPISNFEENVRPFFDTLEAQFVADDATNKYCISGDLSHILFLFLQTPRNQIQDISLDRQSRSDLLDKLIQYYQLHLENFRDLKSIDILRQVLS